METYRELELHGHMDMDTWTHGRIIIFFFHFFDRIHEVRKDIEK